LLAITETGGAVKDAAQADIQRGEERWLSVLSADDRKVFLRALAEMTRVGGAHKLD
ncbi:MAG: MarR family transcriptional regulator, partial [Actinomycetota bacterium]|nr:MarR family transcriptional regulator [Actinomycetota bacterium]